MTKSAFVALLFIFSQAVIQPPTIRQVLTSSGTADMAQYPDYLLETRLDDSVRRGQFFHVGYHISPSAEGLLIFSMNRKLVVELYGWELATLPNQSIVYHKNQIHFAPTHSLEIAAFDPLSGKDTLIYPPKPYQLVRKDFVDRVAKVYKERGADWFRIHNHHMDPEQFDSTLTGDVSVDVASQSLSFAVRFGDPDNANDPIPFTENVHVTCAPIDRITELHCSERKQ